jgi:hypothetical protein
MLMNKILNTLLATPMTVDELRTYVIRCSTETQLYVTLRIYDRVYKEVTHHHSRLDYTIQVMRGKEIEIPSQQTCELILYNLLDLEQYIESVQYLYRKSQTGEPVTCE